MRRATTVTMLVLGFALMLVGYLAAAPWGASSVADSNPTFTGAPLVFILGIVLVVAAAVLYEILPDKRS